MEITNEQALEYIQHHSSPEDPVLYDLYRETHLKVPYPRMLSGHIQGKLLEFISCMIRPRRILEIGTYTGYSAICLAKGLVNEGKLDTIEINDELRELSLRYFEKAGFSDKIRLHNGDAAEIIPDLTELYDLVFMDASKADYVRHFSLIFPKLNLHGFLIVDNVLWDMKVLRVKAHDKETAGVVSFNKHLLQDERMEQIILPLRDGLTVARKIRD